MLELEDSVPSVDDEKLLVSFTPLTLAVAKPVQSVLNLSVPRVNDFPVDLLDVVEEVEAEVN